MSKRKRGGSGSVQEEPVRKDHIVINVGGTRFTTSVSTLTASSTYFEALFSRWDDDHDKDSEIFLDRDPDAFRVILSCMRHRRAVLPEDKDLFSRVLLDAQFLGLDWLENEVKVKTVDHMNSDRFKDHLQQEKAVGEKKRSNEATMVAIFDKAYKSFDDCFERGILPEQFFRMTKEQKRAPPKIKTLIPCPKDSHVVFYDEEHEEQGREARKAVCLALVENCYGHTHIEPVVRGRGTLKPVQDRGLGAWLTTEAEEQLVVASKYAGTNEWTGSDEDGERNWAYAYDNLTGCNYLNEQLVR